MASSPPRTRSRTKKTRDLAGSGPKLSEASPSRLAGDFDDEANSAAGAAAVRRTPRRPRQRQPGTTNSGLTTADKNNTKARTPGRAKAAPTTKKCPAATAAVPASAPPTTPSSTRKPRGVEYVKRKDFDLTIAYALCDPEARGLTFAKAYKLDNGRHWAMNVPGKYQQRYKWWDSLRSDETHLTRARLMVEADLREKAVANEPLTRTEKIVAAALGGEAKFGFGAAPAAGFDAPGAGVGAGVGAGGIPAGGAGGAVAAGAAAAGGYGYGYGYGHGHGYAGGVSIGGAGGGGNNGIVGVPAGATAGLYQFVQGPGGGMMMPVAGGFVPAVANGYTNGATGPPLAAAAGSGGGGDIGGDGGGEVGQAQAPDPTPTHAEPNMHFTDSAATTSAAAAGAGDDADALGKDSTGAIPSVLSLVTSLLFHPNADAIFETARVNVDDAVILLREVLEAEKEKEGVESEHCTLPLPSLELMDAKTIAMVLDVAEKVRSEYKRNEEGESKGGAKPPLDSISGVDETRRLGPDGLSEGLMGLGGCAAGADAPGLLPKGFARPCFDMFQKAMDTYWKMAHDYWEYKSWEEWSVRPCENPSCPKKDEKNVNTKPCFAGRYYCSITCHIAVENMMGAAADGSI